MKRTAILLVLTLLFSVLIHSSSFAAATHSKIKVGFPLIPGFSEVNDDGTYTGLVYDYLRQISQYTGWEYEFIIKDPPTLFEMLKNHEIDLMGGMFKREAYDKYVAYPNYSSGHIYSTLITASDNQSINGSDISSLNHTTIGVYANATNKVESMEGFLAANDITYNIKHYDNQNKYKASLMNKEVDIMLSSDAQPIDNTRVVSRFVSESHYIVTYKGNTEVLNQLNKALQQIQAVDPEFSSKLYYKYVTNSNDNTLYLSEAEKSYINQLQPLVVAAASNWAPFQYLDNNGKLNGISIDILHMIAARTGLKFEFVQTDSHSAAVELVESGQADLTAGVPTSKEVFLGTDIKVTQPYLSFYKVLIKNKQSDNLSDDSVVASTSNHDFLLDHNVENLRRFDTLQESIEAINSGEADYTYGDHYSIEYIMANNNYQNIVISTLVDSNELMYIGLSKNLDAKLLTIMNKAIGSISDYEKSTIALNTSLEREKKVTLKSLINSNPLAAQYIILGVIVIICLVLALLLRIRFRVIRKMYYLANTDPITGSRNFARFKKDAEELLKSDTTYSLSYTDFQTFKYINDRYGYAEGDLILKKVIQILESFLRPNEICCRINSDTFVVLTENRSREELLERYLNYCDRISQIKVGNDSIYTLKLWSGFFCQDDPNQKFTLFEMMDRAILAQKHVKENREITYAFYEDSMRDQMLKEQSIERKMATALQNGEFVIYLQPKYDLQHMKPSSAEALVRWITDEGVIPPSDFIPLFERNYFIVELDKYIFEQCCKVLRYWMDHHMPVIPIAVNVSRVQLSSDEFVRTYIEIKEKYRIPDAYLELEFTESIVFDDTSRLMTIVNKLKNAGFTCAIDDFGRGYSSLTVLKDIPADSLKMDAQFFAEGHDKNKDTIMIESTMAMGKALHMKVVAEGIETWDQVEYLKEIGCDMIQGYVFARPMPVDQFEQFLADALSSSPS